LDFLRASQLYVAINVVCSLFVVVWLNDECRQSKYDEDETSNEMDCNTAQQSIQHVHSEKVSDCMSETNIEMRLSRQAMHCYEQPNQSVQEHQVSVSHLT